jgi:endonuclease/exonuclease/phosphatase family metal-dependent hydrolase
MIMNVVRPCIRVSMAWMIAASVSASTALVGSSRIRSGASRRKARASEMRCRSPPDSRNDPRWPLRWRRSLFGATPAPATFPSILPVFALDRIWVRPAESLVTVERHNTALARRASDHLPLKATLEW